MDKITEEVLTSVIKRLEAVEQKVGIGVFPQSTSHHSPEQKGMPLATPGQIKFIRGLGGDPWDGMLKSEASKLIDELQKRKNQISNQKNQTQTQAPIPDKDPYDEPVQGTPLTQEEIEELGEDAFL